MPKPSKTRPIPLQKALLSAVAAAKAAGALMVSHRLRPKKVNATTQHDIKLDLDVRCQRLIHKILLGRHPSIPVLGEEESDRQILEAEARWVVDPIDGTVNFAHRIPHAAVSIALQVRETPRSAGYSDGYATVAGVVYDPFVGELWTAIRDRPARLNGRPISVSRRSLQEAIVALGFSGRAGSLEAMTGAIQTLSSRVRKIRMTGSAALALAYVADGRFDGYFEKGVRLWDIAAGGLILECAGGRFERELREDGASFRLNATNGRIRSPLKS